MEAVSQGLEGSILGLNGRESKRTGRLKLRTTAARCLPSTSPVLGSTPTSEIAVESTNRTSGECEAGKLGTDASGPTTSNGLTSSLGVSPARTSPTPASGQESRATEADSGAKCSASFANYDPATSSWRTSQLCLDGEWAEFLETWPRTGMTVNGIAYQRQPLVPRISAIESFLWPTPNVAGGGNPPDILQAHNGHFIRPSGKKAHLSLDQAAKMWPTPRAEERGQYQRDRGEKGKERPTLTGAVKGWPTPTAQDTIERKLSWECKEGSRHAVKLHQAVRVENGGQLNPMWVEWLMGFPLGWTALEDSETPLSRKSRNGSPKGSSRASG